ncbi:MAG: SH3 domain-containing protein [Acidobacteriia bacterium]|nr:SH3 domain-containing protein [Terriglobia bacterium]
MYASSLTRIGAAAVFLLLAGCRGGPQRPASIGEAYVGPATLKIRSDLPTQSSTVAIVKHGERLEILQHRRSFLKVRAPNGAEGWTEERQLLAAEDMARLRYLAARAAGMPSQGQATTFADLRVHTQPAAQSPSFLVIRENEKVDVLTHVVMPRTEQARSTPLLPPPPKKQKSTPKKAVKKEPKYPPPPLPKPPGPPPDWLDLSKTVLSEEAEPADEEPSEKPAPPTDDWTLVRAAGGQSGWVLTRRLSMAIPDEVAQYAERRRIVSYFSLGEVLDGDQKKNTWLWTTVGSGAHPYDFDSFRVFVWSLRRHRYETAYIERNLQGYSPVLLQNVAISAGGKAKSEPAAALYQGFSLCLEKKDGQRYRRDYALLGNVVRSAGEKPCEAAAPILEAPAPAPATAPAPAQQKTEPLTERIKKRWHAIKRSLFGG